MMREREAGPAWFVEPASRFGMAAFWFWHHLPDESSCVVALQDMVRSRIRTIMVQARLSLPRSSYLLPAYLERCRFVAETAAQLGLEVEIYDEYNWMPSHGGGLITHANPHLAERHLFWTSQIIDGPETFLSISAIKLAFLEFLGEAGMNWCFEGGRPRWTEWTVVAVAMTVTNGPVDLTSCAVVLRSDDAGCQVSVDTGLVAIGSEITVFVSAWCFTSRLVNYLLSETAERFIEQVYEPLLGVFPAARSFFFDHPHAGFYTWREKTGNAGNSLLWDEHLRAEVARVVFQDIETVVRRPRCRAERA